MRIAGPESGEYHPAEIRFAIAIGIFDMDQILTFTHIDSAVAEGKPGGHI